MARFLFFLADFYQAAARAVFVFFAVLGITRYLYIGIPLFLGLAAFVDLNKRENHHRHSYEGKECFHKLSICNVDIVDSVFFDHQIVDDELLTLGGVLAHVVCQQLFDIIVLTQVHLV